jgi:hypothetical protein
MFFEKVRWEALNVNLSSYIFSSTMEFNHFICVSFVYILGPVYMEVGWPYQEGYPSKRVRK